MPRRSRNPGDRLAVRRLSNNSARRLRKLQEELNVPGPEPRLQVLDTPARPLEPSHAHPPAPAPLRQRLDEEDHLKAKLARHYAQAVGDGPLR